MPSLIMVTHICPVCSNRVDAGQLASSFTLFAIMYVNLYEQPETSNLIGKKKKKKFKL